MNTPGYLSVKNAVCGRFCGSGCADAVRSPIALERGQGRAQRVAKRAQPLVAAAANRQSKPRRPGSRSSTEAFGDCPRIDAAGGGPSLLFRQLQVRLNRVTRTPDRLARPP